MVCVHTTKYSRKSTILIKRECPAGTWEYRIKTMSKQQQHGLSTNDPQVATPRTLPMLTTCQCSQASHLIHPPNFQPVPTNQTQVLSLAGSWADAHE